MSQELGRSSESAEECQGCHKGFIETKESSYWSNVEGPSMYWFYVGLEGLGWFQRVLRTVHIGVIKLQRRCPIRLGIPYDDPAINTAGCI